MKWLVDFATKVPLLFAKKPKEVIKEPEKEEEPVKQFTVVIDPGHGGKDSGAVGEYSEEKKLNLIYSNMLYDLLEQDYHFVPVLTRTKDEYRNLKYRVDFSKKNNADIFISMHCNASALPKPHDCQVFYHRYVDKIDHDTSRWSREMKANFYVLRNHATSKSISAVLVEIGFISNEEDERLLNDEDFQRRFCEGLYNGVKNFFNV